MQIIHSVAELRHALTGKKNIAFVPTMGNLHSGHIELVKVAKQNADFVVVSIFVNPLQFAPTEDLANYPRTLEADCEKLNTVAADIVFAPTVTEIYPDFDGIKLNQTMTIQPPAMANALCGASRPGHFEGVATVVMKLFNLVQPQVAVFGKKDFQQLMVIRELVKQFNMPIDIIGVETKREPSGLAMSSRNGYLSAQQREQAVQLNQVLREIVKSLAVGERNFKALLAQASQKLESLAWQVDYISICSALTLLPATREDTQLVVLGAAKIGQTRLIDNIEFCAKPLN
jgi:pantoate--beta-alanine ligase